MTADLCPAKRELSVRLRAANRDELDQLLLGPWTASETYPCPASGTRPLIFFKSPSVLKQPAVFPRFSLVRYSKK